jgi:2-iminobutanoate/2-iminopropanoate deaminase
MRTAITTKGAAAAIGPYSQAVRIGSLLFVSGQIPLDPSTGDLVEGDIALQTHQVMKNLSAILDAAGYKFSDVVRTSVFLIDLEDFSTVNEVYATYLPSPAPARSTVQVSGLPKRARIEIDLIAALPDAT